MSLPKFSIVIPARNEERLIGKCLASIRAASASYDIEIIVVLNRCTDRTGQIAHDWGVRTIQEDAKNLARIRNAGASKATGEILVTIDSDSAMSPSTLTEIDRMLASGETVGGGAQIRPERSSPGIKMTMFFFGLLMRISRLSGGLFWCYRQDFVALGGFDETFVSGEDLDFALRLRAHGKTVRRPFSTLPNAWIVTSCRKFDAFGDWFILRSPRLVWTLVKGRNQRAADGLYYDFQR